MHVDLLTTKANRSEDTETFCNTVVKSADNHFDQYGQYGFRVTHCNKDYSVCATYPPCLVVPTSVSDTVIRHAARFRSHNRLPVVSHVHHNPLDGTRGVLMRSSQPLSGLTNKRSAQDEFLVRSMAAQSTSKSLVIADARHPTSVLANAVQGRGTESADHYHADRVVFLNLPNMHHIREWLPFRHHDRPCDCDDDGGKTGNAWWRGVERVKEAARQIADWIGEGRAVLVHCSDGWDRTPQLTTLAIFHLLFDTHQQPLTIDVIDRFIGTEWISFGHRFATRHSHFRPLQIIGDTATAAAAAAPSDTESAPIFTQFLDCLRTMPPHMLADGVMEWLDGVEVDSFDPHGPFRGDCEKDRHSHCCC